MAGHRLHPRAAMLLAVALLMLTSTWGCARNVTVGTADPRLNYSIDVRNDTGAGMIVSYNDGRADALLGTVEAGRTERFIIASPASTTIAVSAVSESGARRSGPHSVALTAGQRPLVVLR